MLGIIASLMQRRFTYSIYDVYTDIKRMINDEFKNSFYGARHLAFLLKIGLFSSFLVSAAQAFVVARFLHAVTSLFPNTPKT